jgi:C4-dicarboxylate-specific signal transduction histidine kinase
VILSVHTSHVRAAGLFPDLARVLRAYLPPRAAPGKNAVPSTEHALFRALCHDMRGSLACLEAALRTAGTAEHGRAEMLEMAQAQAAHLASMLRTAEATGGEPPHRPLVSRLLTDVVAASVATSGLPRGQLTVELGEGADRVTVGDARLQRILINLLENAHRHGDGGAVRLTVTAQDGWVEVALSQDGVRAVQVARHLGTDCPPADLTGLGLWSVQRQARELGGRVIWEDDGSALTLRVRLPDR